MVRLREGDFALPCCRRIESVFEQAAQHCTGDPTLMEALRVQLGGMTSRSRLLPAETTYPSLNVISKSAGVSGVRARSREAAHAKYETTETTLLGRGCRQLTM